MGTLRFFEEVVSFKIRRTFGFADYKRSIIFQKRAFFFDPGMKKIERPHSITRIVLPLPIVQITRYL